ncbi:glycogen/starch/alpha-glucan phosphorylase [Dactylosporangium aurantiacum]|uniref:Alpha-1,4 glucan phosphorylase n=1 Tax=Dactylosporangium aurantiacum TaxID=35754 RepID=A0A9Q9I9A9_9ACTN|nr:glycogen/starch/alpha-glucan phosphorylase [Dactylosporangium aurantiacum]MDG6108905.1 glycogen/starch/alpha-glucan phosphorylase [Dactylosporangium aurantiacum]UWZ52199.1 glycogen/starch/alpha-glucan phosphorylase [Dactylosporangium aurantiacum]
MTEARHRPRRTVGDSLEDFERDLISNLYYQRGTTIESASGPDGYHTLAVTVRDRLVDRYARTAAAHYAANPRFVYYLSAEYLLGRQLRQNLLYTDTERWVRPIAEDLGVSLEALEVYDVEPGLGNGGLGRLAACLLDSLATLDIPAVGYGIRYEFGIFKQTFRDGRQVERPDDWTFYGNPWEFPAPDDRQLVGFYGATQPDPRDPGGLRRVWVPGETVRGEPRHMLVPGYGTQTVNIIRLWQARASRESFDLARFGVGQYVEAVDDIVRAENISKVLYPDDSTEPGRELRLKQQYFLVACSLRDIIRRYRLRNSGWEHFADKVVIQLNDTHPVMAVTELMRLLVDEHGVGWDEAWDITRRTFNYTCHTLLPEALETWPVRLLERLLPRHMEIIYAINHFFLEEVRAAYPGDTDMPRRMSIIQEGDERRVRMAHLAVIGSTAVNGVAELQTKLLAETTLHDFAVLWPERFHNVTNGVTPRRFLRMANPRLSELITGALGDEGWLTDLERLHGLGTHADDPDFRAAWRAVKRQNKGDLAAAVERATGVLIDPDALADVMIKRFHEYKRQQLKLLHVITMMNRIRADPQATYVPRTVLFGGKAAPGYLAMKQLIELVNAVAGVVNTDPVLARHLRVVFPPDYNVTKAQFVIPAADLSEQISLAGKEASGTGNMKLALNGALTIGTLDGANIEIRDRVGADNFFLFGMDAQAAADLRRSGYSPRAYYEADFELRLAVDTIASGAFAKGDRDAFAPVVDAMLHRDEYMALADYRAYVDCQDTVEQAWLDTERWTRMSILNTARCGFFSSDRTVREYCERIWKVDPVRVNP